MTRKHSQSFIGIDVSKQLLEVAAHESNYQFRCANKASAFGELLVELNALRPALIVLEATAGLERAVVTALHTAGLPVVVVNPRQVRAFAKAVGQLAKTDRLDARVLAHFAAAVKPPPRPIKSKDEQELDALTGRRGQLIDMLTDEKNRRGAAATDGLRDEIEEHIDWLEDRIAEIDEQLKSLLKGSARWQAMDHILQSGPALARCPCKCLESPCMKTRKRSPAHPVTRMPQLGAQGWELVSVAADNSNYTDRLKRPKLDASRPRRGD